MTELPKKTESTPAQSRRSHVSSVVRRFLLPGGLLGAGLAGFVLLSREAARPKLPPAKPQAVRVRLTEVRARDFPVVLRSQGVVRAREDITLNAQVSARVMRISPSCEDGEFFTEGTLLIELEPEDFVTAVALAEARRRGAEAAWQLAALNHRRNLEMLKDRLLPEAQVDVTAATLAQAEAEEKAAAAQLDRARRDLERTKVRAPFNGCVRRRQAGPGQLINAGATLASIFSVDAAEVRLPVSGRELSFLDLPGSSSGPPIEVELRDALSRDADARWRGRIFRTEGALDENSLEVFAIVQVNDPFGRQSGGPPLRLGQPVTGFIPGKTLTNVIALPRVAVRELDRVFLVDREKLTLSSRRIQPLWSDEEHVVAAADGFPNPALVVTTHLVYAPEGAKVEIIPDSPGLTNAAAGTNRAVLKPAAGKERP